MFDIGWSELLVIAVIAIVVVGPKDLPRMMRNIGRYVGKAKSMARDFQSQFDDMVRDTELEDVRKSISDITSGSPANSILEPFTSAADDLQKTVENSDTPATPTKPAGATAKGQKTKKSVARKKTTPKNKTTAKKPAGKPSAKPAGKPVAKKPAPAKKTAAPAPKKPSQRKSPAKPAAKPAKAGSAV